MTDRIGFIGLGFMGHGMAKNLVEKGHPLTIMGHRNRAPIDDLVKRGAKEVKERGRCGEEFRHRVPLRHRLGRGGSAGAPRRRPQGRRAEGPDHRRLLDLRSQFDRGARRRIEGRRHFLLRRAARRHAGAGRGGKALGRRRLRRGCVAAARRRDRQMGGESRARRRARRRPQDEAPDEFLRHGLCRDLFGSARGRAESRPLAADLRFRHSRQPHGLRLLPDVLFLCARSQSRRAQIHAQERAQGHEISRGHGAERRCRQSGRRRGEELLRDGRSRGPRRGFRADAVGFRRRTERHCARAIEANRRRNNGLPIHRDILRLEKFHQPFMRAFAADAALLHAAERRGRIGDETAIEADHAEIEFLRHAHAA